MDQPRKLTFTLSALVCWFLGVAGKLALAQTTQCFDPDNISLDPQSHMRPWASLLPPVAAEYIKNEECFCASAIPAEEIDATRHYSQLTEFDAIYVESIHLLERVSLEQAAARLKQYCDERLRLFDNALVFTPSKALDYSLHWLASQRLWDSTREFFKRGMLNFENNLDKWLELADQNRLSLVYVFIHYLKNGYDFKTAANTNLQKLSWIEQFNQLPYRLEILNCIAASPNRHDNYFQPPMTSPVSPWFQALEPHIMELLETNSGVVCREQFKNPADFETAAIWDIHERQLAIFEKFIALSHAITEGLAPKSAFLASMATTTALINEQQFPLQPTEALDYSIGLLSTRRHLTKKIKALLLTGMKNYGDLNDWSRLAKELNWRFIENFLRPYIKATQQSSPASLFSEARQQHFIVGTDSLAKPNLSG